MAEKGTNPVSDVVDSNLTATQSSSASQGTSNQQSSDGCKWTPNEELLKCLTDMGISPAAGEKALFFTGNNSIESATNWIFDHSDEEDDDLPLTDYQKSGQPNQWSSDEQSTDELKQRAVLEMFKMVFVVNSSLEMGQGKIAAQVAHAAIALHSILLQNESKFGNSLLKWFEFGETKIVLKGDTSKHLIDLQSMAMNRGIPCYLVQDAGKTQVPKGSVTVLSLFGRVDIIDSVTGQLKLL